MSEEYEDAFTEETNTQAANDDLYKIQDPKRKFVLKADDHHVSMNPETSMYTVTKEGVLTAKSIVESKAFVALADEEDITNRLRSKAKNRTLSFQTGIAWPNGEMITLYVVNGGIVEYRSNIGVVTGDGKDYITGRPTEYMGTYVSIGIPKWFHTFLVDQFNQLGIEIVPAEKEYVTKDYIFMTANINKGFNPIAVVKSAKNTVVMDGQDRNLKTLLMKVQKNIIGNLGIEIKLKRAKDYSDMFRRYNISPGLRVLEVHDFTTISGPSLIKAVTFESEGTVTSDELLKALAGPVKAKGTTTAARPVDAKAASKGTKGTSTPAKGKDTVAVSASKGTPSSSSSSSSNSVATAPYDETVSDDD